MATTTTSIPASRPQGRTHGPMTPIALADMAGLLTMRQSGISFQPFMLKSLCDHLPQGVLHQAEPVVDPVDGSLAIKVTLRSVRPERLHEEDREGDNSPSRLRVRYWEPEAFLIIRLALANGGTLFVDDNCVGRTERNPEGKQHYPEFYQKGLTANRVFMDPQPGQRVRQIVDRSHPWGHRDCRRRRLYIENGQPGAVRGVPEFLAMAVEHYVKPNPQDKLTGYQRFELNAAEYKQHLEDALALHAAYNPSASPEEIVAWLNREKLPA